MQLVKDIENHKIFIIEQDKVLVEFGFVGDEYIITFYTDKKVPITKELDSSFYLQYLELLNHSYEFGNCFSHQNKNEIVWFSDGYCNLEDEWETCVKNRLLLQKDNDTIYLSGVNPFFDNHHISGRIRPVIFSPAGNGFYSNNLETGFTFQDDVIMIHQNILERQKVKRKD